MDMSLSERMDELSQAFMAILAKYYKQYFHNGRKLVEPEEGMKATNEYKMRNDTYSVFVQAHILKTNHPDDVVRLSDAYNLFKDWFMN